SAAEIMIGLFDYYAEKMAKVLVMGKLVAIYMAVIIPTLPFVFFFFAVIGWVIHIIQAMVGLLLWSIMHMIPERSFVGSQTQGYLTVVALFFRPMLSLMGFFLAFVISDPLLTFTTDNFFMIMGAVQFTSYTLIAALWQFFLLMAWVFLYCTILLPVMFLIFGLPSSLAESVLAWLGTHLSRSLGETGLAQNAGRSANPIAQYYNNNGGGNGGGSPSPRSPSPNTPSGGGGGNPRKGDGTSLMNKSNQASASPSGAMSSLPPVSNSESHTVNGNGNVGWQSAMASGARNGGVIGAFAAGGAYAGRSTLNNQAQAGTSVLQDVQNTNSIYNIEGEQQDYTNDVSGSNSIVPD
ncbi:DotA/TraY family protein, partial [Acinetobacter baumannii]|nr:DotA/TraY family protein [Acinetobacter baumannii]